MCAIKMKVILLIVLFPFCILGQTSRNTWIELGVKGKISDKLGWQAEVTNRFGPNNIERFFVQAGVKYKLTKWFKPSFDYRFSLDKDSYTNYQPSHRFLLNANFEKELVKNLDAAMRVRYQYDFSSWNRDYGYQQSVSNTLRFKPELQYDIKKTVFSPYIGAEFFYSLERYNPYFYKMRFTLGTDIEVSDPLKISLGYLYDRELFDKNNYPKKRHVLTIGFSYKIE